MKRIKKKEIKGGIEQASKNFRHPSPCYWIICMAKTEVIIEPNSQKYPIKVTKVSRYFGIIISEVKANIGGIDPPIPNPEMPLQMISSGKFLTNGLTTAKTVLTNTLYSSVLLLPNLSPKLPTSNPPNSIPAKVTPVKNYFVRTSSLYSSINESEAIMNDMDTIPIESPMLLNPMMKTSKQWNQLSPVFSINISIFNSSNYPNLSLLF